MTRAFADIHRAVSTVTPASGTSVTTAEAKAHANVGHSDDDSYIDDLVSVAERVFQSHTGRQLLDATFLLELDAWPCDDIQLPRSPAASVGFVKYYDADDVLTTLDSADYQTDFNSIVARLRPEYGVAFPTVRYRKLLPIQVQFVAGYGVAADVPVEFKQAVKALVAYWYRVREPVQAAKYAELPYYLQALMDAYRIWEF